MFLREEVKEIIHHVERHGYVFDFDRFVRVMAEAIAALHEQRHVRRDFPSTAASWPAPLGSSRTSD